MRTWLPEGITLLIATIALSLFQKKGLKMFCALLNLSLSRVGAEREDWLELTDATRRANGQPLTEAGRNVKQGSRRAAAAERRASTSQLRTEMQTLLLSYGRNSGSSRRFFTVALVSAFETF